jgi:hypothetical protein
MKLDNVQETIKLYPIIFKSEDRGFRNLSAYLNHIRSDLR